MDGQKAGAFKKVERTTRGTERNVQYETLVSFTWRYVLITLSEFETVSDTTEAQNPMRARRASQTTSGCFGGSAMASERKLYCTAARVRGRGQLWAGTGAPPSGGGIELGA